MRTVTSLEMALCSLDTHAVVDELVDFLDALVRRDLDSEEAREYAQVFLDRLTPVRQAGVCE